MNEDIILVKHQLASLLKNNEWIGFVEQSRQLTNDDVIALTKNINLAIFAELNRNQANQITVNDYVTNIADIIKLNADVSNGIEITVAAAPNSKKLDGTAIFAIEIIADY